MGLSKLIGKVLITAKTGERFGLEKITAPEICVATAELGAYGHDMQKEEPKNAPWGQRRMG